MWLLPAKKLQLMRIEYFETIDSLYGNIKISGIIKIECNFDLYQSFLKILNIYGYKLRLVLKFSVESGKVALSDFHFLKDLLNQSLCFSHRMF